MHGIVTGIYTYSFGNGENVNQFYTRKVVFALKSRSFKILGNIKSK